MKEGREKSLLYVFFLVLAILQLTLIFLNEKTFGGADSISHFQMAKYAFKYPHLFLDLWGKPVYTTLLSVFALAGFQSAQFFNVVVAIFSLLFVYKIAEQYYPKAALSATIMAAFAPIYFSLMTSCLTEVLFGFVLIVSVYFFLKNKYILSAVILSFIPYVRSEGIVFLPVFAVAYIFSRSYRSVFFLAVGTIFYSVVGFLAFGDILWLVNRFPYPTGDSVYGSGNLFHFIKKSNVIFGIPFIAALVLGLFAEQAELFKKFSLTNPKTIRFILIAGSWLTYFAAHSYVWWQGRGGSLGLIRVIGGVIPLAALTAAIGIAFIYEKIRNVRIASGVVVLLVASQVVLFFNQNKVPVKAPVTDKLIEESSHFVKDKQLSGKVYYFNPMIVFHLGIDPYNKSKSNWGIGDKMRPSNSMNYDDILIWDAHFGPNEGRTSLASLQNDPSLQLLKTFLPVEKIKVLGGYDYGVYIFQKVKNKTSTASSESLVRTLGITNSNAPQIVQHKNEKALELTAASEYSPNVIVAMDELSEKEIIDVKLSIQFESETVLVEKEVLLIISVENGRDNLRYEKQSLIWNEGDSDWKTTELETRFSAAIPGSSIIKMYIWNKDRKKIWVKSLTAEVKAL
jgi:ABC-type cobalt transport system substrate-binding protein